MLTVISMYFFMGIIYVYNKNAQSKDKKKLRNSITTKFILLSIVNTLIIYSHYVGFFVLFVQFLYLSFNPSFLLKYWKKILLGAAIIGTLYSPNILVTLNRIINFSSGTWVRPPEGFESIYNMLWSFSNAPVVTVFVIIILISSFLKYVVNYKKEQKNTYYGFVIFCFVFIFFFIFGISYWMPMFLDRYLMPAAIAFIFTLGISMDYLIRKPRFNFIIPLFISLLFIITVKPNITNKRNAKETVEKIKEIKDTNTLVIICPSTFILNFSYYYNMEIFKNYNTTDIYTNVNKALISENIYGINNIKEIDIKKWNSIVFLDASANFSYPNNNIKKELDKNYHLKNEYKFYEIFNVFEYEVK
jgi:hypothetical protein